MERKRKHIFLPFTTTYLCKSAFSDFDKKQTNIGNGNCGTGTKVCLPNIPPPYQNNLCSHTSTPKILTKNCCC